MIQASESGSFTVTEIESNELQITYRKDVRPIFSKSCASCHDSTSELPNLLDYDIAFALKDIIKEKLESGKMPHSGMADFSTHEKNLVIRWVEQGAKK